MACCFGIAGAVVGMSQVWYIGPIGKMAGAASGADLGFEVRQKGLNIIAHITDTCFFFKSMYSLQLVLQL